MNQRDKKVSVCLATFNGEKYILPQINSILAQLTDKDEIIISDDASWDNTLDLIRSINDKRINILGVQSFGSPVFNFENALKFADGDFIFLSDQDDIWLDHKVDSMVNEMESGYDLVVSDCEIVDENLNTLHPSYFKFNNSRPGFLNNLIKNGFMGCCMAFRKPVLVSCLPFPSDLPMHDSYIGLVAEAKYKVKFLKTPLILHRKHGDNASFTAQGRSSYSYLTKFLFRIKLIKAILKSI